jgi:hypothetical protein
MPQACTATTGLDSPVAAALTVVRAIDDVTGFETESLDWMS